jgi:ADP-ribose pyrophosphatase
MSNGIEERLLSIEQIYIGRIVNLRVDRVRLPSGKETIREVVEHRGAVAIVPIDEENRVLMVRQYRRPAGRALLEIPAGTLEIGEDPIACAQRELQEETGFAADCIEPLTAFFSAPGFCTEYLRVYQASGLHYSPLEADADENIAVERFSLPEAREMVRRGDICDAKSIIGLLLARS